MLVVMLVAILAAILVVMLVAILAAILVVMLVATRRSSSRAGASRAFVNTRYSARHTALMCRTNSNTSSNTE